MDSNMDNHERQLHSGTSETSGSHLQTSNYRSAIARLILKSRLACSLPALEPAELKIAVGAWLEILNGAVPLPRLHDAYVAAMRQKDSNFAIGAPEIVSAWGEIRESERSKPARLNFRQLSGDVCSKCNGTGTEVVRDEFHETTSARPCSH